MPKLLDLLNEEDKVMAKKIIKQLEELSPTANKHLEEINKLGIKLSQVDSMNDFHMLVKTIIDKKNEIRSAFNDVRTKLFNNNKIMNAVKEYLTDANAHALLQVIQPHLILKNEIISTKERLTKNDLVANLPEDQRQIIEKFISDVKNLQSLADKITLRKEDLRQQLNKATTQEEINQLEDEIEVQSIQLLNFYESSVTYPQNEATAGVLISFLEQNPHILKIMKSFNIDEPLRDDILHATMRLEKQHAAPGP